MGFKAHWFQFLFLFLCISTASYSKPLPVESTFKGDMCTPKTGKRVVHKIHARDVGSDFNDPEYLSALAENTDPHDAASITDYDHVEDSEDESLDDHVSNSGDVIELGGSRADFFYESSADKYEDGDYDDSFGDDDIVDYDKEHDEPDETSDYDDYDDTFWGNDIIDDNEVRKNLPEEALDNDDDDIDSSGEAPGSFGDDTKVVSPDDDGDAEAFGNVDVDDDNETNNESPDGIPNDDDTYSDKVEGPMQVLEEPPSLKHIHKFDHKSKSSRPRNPLNKINDSKLGRLLKKHHNKDAKRKNSVKKYVDDDINDDDEVGDFKLSNKRKEKISRHKGRRTLSVSQNSDFSQVQKSEVSGSQDQRNGGNSVDRNVDDYDRQFLASRGDFFFENKFENPSASDIEKQNGGSTLDTNVDKDNAQYVEEDEIEGEEEEENQMNDMNSSHSNDDNNVSEPGLTSDSIFEEDKVEGEEEEEDNESNDIGHSSHKDDTNFDENEVGGNSKDDLLTDDDKQNDIASGIDAH